MSQNILVRTVSVVIILYILCFLILKHIFADFTYFDAARQRYFSAYTLKELFENVDSGNVTGFINDINF